MPGNPTRSLFQDDFSSSPKKPPEDKNQVRFIIIFMGLDITSTRFHSWLKQQGISFQHTAMLGRQTFYGLDAARLSRTATHAGLEMSTKQAAGILTERQGYAEPYYQWLGAERVDSFDYSDYEQATRIWDMNGPAPEEALAQYDFVFDGGTLEHIFNYAGALREAMALVKPGGVFLSATPANSYLGHGFYQFGPDLPYSILTPANGYQCGGVFVVEMRRDPVFYEVLAPDRSRGRALASTAWPAVMLFWGRRTGSVPATLSAQQPDYQEAWDGEQHQERVTNTHRATLNHLLAGLSEGRRIDLLRLMKLGYVTLKGNAFFDQNCFKAAPEI